MLIDSVSGMEESKGEEREPLRGGSAKRGKRRAKVEISPGYEWVAYTCGIKNRQGVLR